MKKVLILIITMMFILSLGMVYGEEVDVTIIDYDVFVNGERILTEESQYPLFNYSGITYFPLTYDNCRSFNLHSYFSNELGLSVKRVNYNTHPLKQNFLGSQNVLGSKLKATIATAPIRVNEKRISNASETYPILVYKDIFYFPMTWRFVYNEFQWNMKWSNETGLHINPEGREVFLDVELRGEKAVSETKDVMSKEDLRDLNESVVHLQVTDHFDNVKYYNGFYIGNGEIVTSDEVIYTGKTIEILTSDGQYMYENVIKFGFNSKHQIGVLYVEDLDLEPMAINRNYSAQIDEELYFLIIENNKFDSLLPLKVDNLLEDDVIDVSGLTDPAYAKIYEIKHYGSPVINAYGQVMGVISNDGYGGFHVSDIDYVDQLTLMYDKEKRDAIKPYTNSVQPIDNVVYSNAGNYLNIIWDYNGADYYKIYMTREVDGVTTEIDSMWQWENDDIYIKFPEDTDIILNIVAVKNDIESSPYSIYAVSANYKYNSILSKVDYEIPEITIEGYTFKIDTISFTTWRDKIIVNMDTSVDDLNDNLEISLKYKDELYLFLKGVTVELSEIFDADVNIYLEVDDWLPEDIEYIEEYSIYPLYETWLGDGSGSSQVHMSIISVESDSDTYKYWTDEY